MVFEYMRHGDLNRFLRYVTVQTPHQTMPAEQNADPFCDHKVCCRFSQQILAFEHVPRLCGSEKVLDERQQRRQQKKLLQTPHCLFFTADSSEAPKISVRKCLSEASKCDSVTAATQTEADKYDSVITKAKTNS